MRKTIFTIVGIVVAGAATLLDWVGRFSNATDLGKFFGLLDENEPHSFTLHDIAASLPWHTPYVVFLLGIFVIALTWRKELSAFLGRESIWPNPRTFLLNIIDDYRRSILPKIDFKPDKSDMYMLPLDPVVKQFFGDKSKRDWEIRIRAIANKLAKDVKVRVVEIENRKQIQPFELQMVGASEQQDTYTLDPNISVLFAVARWSEQSSIRDIVLLPRYGDEIPLLAEYFDSPQVLPTLPQLRCRFLLVASAKGKELGRCWVHFTIRDNGRLDVKKGADYLSEQMKALG